MMATDGWYPFPTLSNPFHSRDDALLAVKGFSGKAGGLFNANSV